MDFPLSVNQMIQATQSKINYLEQELPKAWVLHRGSPGNHEMYKEYKDLAVEIRKQYRQLKELKGSKNV